MADDGLNDHSFLATDLEYTWTIARLLSCLAQPDLLDASLEAHGRDGKDSGS